jgi:hypothetical protein
MRQNGNEWDSLYEMARVIAQSKAKVRHYGDDSISVACLAVADGCHSPLFRPRPNPHAAIRS